MSGPLSVLGAVCGTVIAKVCELSPALNLLGAILGAAIPPIVSAAGPRRGLRATVAVALTILAVTVTYSGFTALAYASQQPPTFPLPPGVPPPSPASTTAPPPAQRPDIAVDPTDKLACVRHDCVRPVTVTSTGTAPLVIGTIGLDGANAGEFRLSSDCPNRTLRPGKNCAITVTFEPASSAGTTRRARLVINQNLPGPPSYLSLQGNLPPVNLAISTQGVQCTYRHTGTTNQLQIRFHLTATKPFSEPVRVAARNSSGPAVDYPSTAPGLSTATLTLTPTQFGRQQLILLTIDPHNEIAEQDETDNQIAITLTIPAKPTTGTLACTAVPNLPRTR